VASCNKNCYDYWVRCCAILSCGGGNLLLVEEMQKEYKLKLSKKKDHFLDEYYLASEPMFCVECLDELWYGRKTQNITLVLSHERSENAYLMEATRTERNYTVTLSNGRTIRKWIYETLDNEIRRNFGKAVWLSVM
jgi:hypothetical protein